MIDINKIIPWASTEEPKRKKNEYYLKNRERILAKQKEYREAHREYYRQYSIEYAKTHAEYKRQKGREYYRRKVAKILGDKQKGV